MGVWSAVLGAVLVEAAVKSAVAALSSAMSIGRLGSSMLLGFCAIWLFVSLLVVYAGGGGDERVPFPVAALVVMPVAAPVVTAEGLLHGGAPQRDARKMHDSENDSIMYFYNARQDSGKDMGGLGYSGNPAGMLSAANIPGGIPQFAQGSLHGPGGLPARGNLSNVGPHNLALGGLAGNAAVAAAAAAAAAAGNKQLPSRGMSPNLVAANASLAGRNLGGAPGSSVGLGAMNISANGPRTIAGMGMGQLGGAVTPPLRPVDLGSGYSRSSELLAMVGKGIVAALHNWCMYAVIFVHVVVLTCDASRLFSISHYVCMSCVLPP
eukprot:jgi/Chlat1/7987/Chrsp7S07744